jgi:hypothetical protein
MAQRRRQAKDGRRRGAPGLPPLSGEAPRAGGERGSGLSDWEEGSGREEISGRARARPPASRWSKAGAGGGGSAAGQPGTGGGGLQFLFGLFGGV